MPSTVSSNGGSVAWTSQCGESKGAAYFHAKRPVDPIQCGHLIRDISTTGCILFGVRRMICQMGRLGQVVSGHYSLSRVLADPSLVRCQNTASLGRVTHCDSRTGQGLGVVQPLEGTLAGEYGTPSRGRRKDNIATKARGDRSVDARSPQSQSSRGPHPPWRSRPRPETPEAAAWQPPRRSWRLCVLPSSFLSGSPHPERTTGQDKSQPSGLSARNAQIGTNRRGRGGPYVSQPTPTLPARPRCARRCAPAKGKRLRESQRDTTPLRKSCPPPWAPPHAA